MQYHDVGEFQTTYIPSFTTTCTVHCPSVDVLPVLLKQWQCYLHSVYQSDIEKAAMYMYPFTGLSRY